MLSFPIALIIVLVLAGVALMPKTRAPQPASEVKQSISPTPLFASEQAPQQSLRQQQAAEESAAVADIYRRKADEAWRTEIQAKAANMFGEDLESA